MNSVKLMRVGALVGAIAVAHLTAAQTAKSPYDSVNTLIGSAGGGNTFPGATLPFGMMQWSPDTNTDAWYEYSQSARPGIAAANSILGFGLTHISGAGCELYGDFAVLPIAGELTTSPGTDITQYAVKFDHAQEETHPGYYAVTLANGVKVELTVTDRAGIARFTFPQGMPARLLVNAGSSAGTFGTRNNQPGTSEDGNSITLTNLDSYEAYSRAGHFCGTDSHYTIYGAGKFNKPYKKAVLWQDSTVVGDGKEAKGKHSGVWLDFGNERQIELKTAVSFVDSDGARGNLKHDIAGWDFDGRNSSIVSKSKEEPRRSRPSSTPASITRFSRPQYSAMPTAATWASTKQCTLLPATKKRNTRIFLIGISIATPCSFRHCLSRSVRATCCNRWSTMLNRAASFRAGKLPTT
jgi:putative alpha-1,2-mannosidase